MERVSGYVVDGIYYVYTSNGSPLDIVILLSKLLE